MAQKTGEKTVKRYFEKLRVWRRDHGLKSILVCFCTFLTLFSLSVIIWVIFSRGLGALSPALFSPTYTSENYSLFPALINTLTTVFLSLAMALPIGVGAAIYLMEYAGRKNPLVRVIRAFTETLAAIPSVIYGLFGLLFFVGKLGWGYSVLSGAATLAIMILPIVMRTSEEAIRAVPDSFREGSFGLGAGRLRTVFCVVLPSARSGIFSGVLLSAGRIVGETTALIYTAGTVAQIARPTESGRTLSVHMFALWNEGLTPDLAYSTAVVLLLLTLLFPVLSRSLSRHAGRNRR